jgi:hypothetical protein
MYLYLVPISWLEFFCYSIVCVPYRFWMLILYWTSTLQSFFSLCTGGFFTPDCFLCSSFLIWYNAICLFVYCFLWFWGLVPKQNKTKKPHNKLMFEMFSLFFFLVFLQFQVSNLGLWSIWVNFCMAKGIPSAYEYPFFPAPFF